MQQIYILLLGPSFKFVKNKSEQIHIALEANMVTYSSMYHLESLLILIFFSKPTLNILKIESIL